MKKLIYIIPGLGENCGAVRYQNLIKALKAEGYSVKEVNPDWYRPLSEAIFKVPKDAILFGFSLGGVLAYLVARKYPCKKVIFASLSPIHTFSFKMFSKFLTTFMAKPLAEEITKDLKTIKVSLKTLKVPHITLAGDREKDLKAQFLVPKTGHYLSKAYIKAVVGVVGQN